MREFSSRSVIKKIITNVVVVVACSQVLHLLQRNKLLPAGKELSHSLPVVHGVYAFRRLEGFFFDALVLAFRAGCFLRGISSLSLAKSSIDFLSLSLCVRCFLRAERLFFSVLPFSSLHLSAVSLDCFLMSETPHQLPVDQFFFLQTAQWRAWSHEELSSANGLQGSFGVRERSTACRSSTRILGF